MRQKGPNGKAKPESPAAKVVAAFGEIELAHLTGLSIDALRKWRRKKATGGTGGLVPAGYQDRLLRAAAERGLDLAATDLIGEAY